MQQRGSVPAYDFALPVVLLGKENDRYLSKANINITPLDKRNVLLFVEENFTLEKGMYISISFIRPDDISLLRNNRFKKRIGMHESFGVPMYQDIENVMIFLLRDVLDIDGVELFVAEIEEIITDAGMTETLNAGALLEGKHAYYQASYQEKKSVESMKNAPYHFNFKYKICRKKADGATYKELERKYGVYLETIKDWYLLYTVFGKEGLTKKMAHELGNKRFTLEQKQALARQVINKEKSFRDIVREERVSLSRIRNWVKKERRSYV